jgi:cob(I)alamin adenosyltransferase
MAEKAQITSVEAIESFRARLVVFLGQVRPVLEEVGGELSRTQNWLQSDRRQFWETELRRRQRRLDEAKQELFNATLSSLKTGTSALQHMAVQRAQQAVHEAEAKLGVLKKWDSELENRAAPLKKQIEQLHGFLATDMGRAVAYLDQILRTLDAYRSVALSRSEKSVAAVPEKTEAQK